MLKQNMFTIPYWNLPVLNFKEKKKQLTNMLKSYPEKKVGIQPFSTNRQTDRSGLSEAFTQICGEELEMLSKQIESDMAITDIWSVSYGKNEYHSPHNHGSVGLSGILYLDLPKDAPVTSYIQPWNDFTTDNTIYLPLQVTEGAIVIVPQFIQHFSTPNKAKTKKRIISWDMKYM